MPDVMTAPIHTLPEMTLAEAFAGKPLSALAEIVKGRRASATPSPVAADYALHTATDIAGAIVKLPDMRGILRAVEREVVRLALAKTRGNMSAAARLLGIERKAFERRMVRHKVQARR